jgi:hypothetical protein
VSWCLGGKKPLSSLEVSLVFLLTPLALFYLFSVLSRPIFDEKFTLIVSPFFFLLVARGLAGLRRLSSATALAALLLIFGAATHQLTNYFYVPRYAKSPPWRELVARIHDGAQPGDLLIFNFPDPATPYYNADRLPAVLLPASGHPSPKEVDVALPEALQGHPRAWFIPQPAENWDRDGLVGRWLQRHADRQGVVQAGPLLAELYLSLQTFLEKMERQEATFGGEIRLLGYDIECQKGRGERWGDACPPALAGGTGLALTLYWQALAPVPTSYTVFTHLTGPDGSIQGQQDNPPVMGTYPTSEWSPGETIVDKYVIIVARGAPPGDYSLRVGLYDPATGERVAATDESGPLADNQVVLKHRLRVETQ